MVGIVVAAHGGLAEGLIATTQMMIGPLKQVEAVAIYAKEGIKDLEKKLEEAINKVDTGNGILILIDIFGGSPATVSLSFIDKYNIKVVSGVNLPVILEVTTHHEFCGLEDLANLALATGRKSILMADEIFRDKRKKI